MSRFPLQYYDSSDDYEDYFPSNCHHGNILSECEECDEEINSRGGIDKCMNCGKYMYNDRMRYPDQVCKSGCRNPNEY